MSHFLSLPWTIDLGTKLAASAEESLAQAFAQATLLLLGIPIYRCSFWWHL